MLPLPAVVPLGSLATETRINFVGSLLVTVTVRSLLGAASTEPVARISKLAPIPVGGEFRNKWPEICPLPDRETVCGLLAALSAMFNVADRAPEFAGVKVMLICAVPPFGGTVIGVAVVTANSLALAPLSVRLEITRLPLPVFVTVTDCGELVVPTGTKLKDTVVGFRFTTGCVPVPFTLT